MADAWYPGPRVIVLVADEEEGERSVGFARVAGIYGVTVLELGTGWLARDAAGALRRTLGERRQVADFLGSEEAREDNRVRPTYGFFSYGPVGDWDAEDLHEEPLEDLPEEPETLAAEEASVDVLGWRGRAVALALLEAVRLSRLAFEVARTGPGLSQAAIEALLVLLCSPSHERGVSATDLESLLRSGRGVQFALEELHAAGYAEPDGGIEEDGIGPDWFLTEAGRDAAARWIGRVLPLFAGWPPERRDVDDADGMP